MVSAPRVAFGLRGSPLEPSPARSGGRDRSLAAAFHSPTLREPFRARPRLGQHSWQTASGSHRADGRSVRLRTPPLGALSAIRGESTFETRFRLVRGTHGCFSTSRSRSGRFTSLPIAAVKWTCLREAHPDSAPDHPLLPALAFFTECLERIDALDSLRPAGLAVPQTSWNHMQYAPGVGRSQRNSMTTA